MINQATDDRLEDAVDQFEETWSVDSLSGIDQLLAGHGLSDDDGALAELVRIDIERRYELGLSIELKDYFDRFGVLRHCPNRVAEIAFEDFRVRQDKGLPVVASRWSGLPGITSESWYRQLIERDSRPRRVPDRLRIDPSHDSAFEVALQEAGFDLVQPIGEGAFSRVYLATQRELADRFVVLKIVNEALSEPECMAMLQHTNIVPLYSVHRILDRSVLCMPYTGRVTLNDFLAEKQEVSARGGQSLVTTVQAHLGDTQVASSRTEAEESTLQEALSNLQEIPRPLQTFAGFECDELAMWLFERLAGALAHAHDRGVLHNDLKPSNVLIRNDGEPALLDFNLAQTISGKPPRHAGGTLPYMSPETCRALMGQDVHSDPASDIYSLGVMLFEFVTGRLPYPTPRSIAPIDLSPAVEAKRIPPSWRKGDQVTPGLKSVIQRCLAFDPSDRYGSAEQLQADLQSERNDLRLQHASEPASSVVKKWSRRHPKVTSSGGVAAALLVVLIPLAYLALTYQKDNSILQLQSAYLQFETDSSDFLKSIVIEPNRVRETSLEEGMGLLEQHRMSTPDEIRALVKAHQAEDRTAVEDVIRRHVIQLGLMERRRLSQKRMVDVEASRQFGRLDRLIALAEAADGDSSSRSRLLLESDRARLAGMADREKQLLRRAQGMSLNSDTAVYLESLRLIADDNHTAARKCLEMLADRNSVPAAMRWTLLSQAQFANHQYDDVILSLTQAIARSPKAAMLYTMRGRAYRENQQRLMAENDYREAIELDPECVEAISLLAHLRRENGDHVESLELYDRLLERSERMVTSLLGRSKCLERLGRSEEALVDRKLAMAIDCDESAELLQRALARLEDEPEAAAQDFLRACELDPDRPYALRKSALNLTYPLGRHEEAIRLFSQAIDLRSGGVDERALVGRALAYIRTGRVKEALQDLKVAMAEPNDAFSLYQAACVHALTPYPRNHRRAVVLLAKALESGFQPRSLENDPDLQSLRGVEGFAAVLQSHELAKKAGNQTSNRPKVTPGGAQRSQTSGGRPSGIPFSLRTP